MQDKKLYQIYISTLLSRSVDRHIDNDRQNEIIHFIILAFVLGIGIEAFC